MRKVSGSGITPYGGAASEPAQTIDSACELMPVHEHAGIQFVLLADDMQLKNGRYANRRISELIRSVEGRDYVGYVWKVASVEMRSVLRRHFSD